MRRREFITLLGGAAAMWPLAAIAQQADQVRRIGVLSNIGESDLEAQSMVTALHEELRKLGWIDGRNLRVDHRWAVGNPERATAFAKELVALKPEVIVGHTTPSVIALRKQTGTIPIVFVQIPIRSAPGLLPTWRVRMATSPASPTSILQWSANGSNCSKRSRPVSSG